jgi:hypothetical protein
MENVSCVTGRAELAQREKEREERIRRIKEMQEEERKKKLEELKQHVSVLFDKSTVTESCHDATPSLMNLQYSMYRYGTGRYRSNHYYYYYYFFLYQWNFSRAEEFLNYNKYWLKPKL